MTMGAAAELVVNACEDEIEGFAVAVAMRLQELDYLSIGGTHSTRL